MGVGRSGWALACIGVSDDSLKFCQHSKASSITTKVSESVMHGFNVVQITHSIKGEGI